MPTDSIRLDKVEAEVTTIRNDMGDLKHEVTTVKGDIRAFGGILQRIEQSVGKAHEAMDARDERSRHSPVAIATVLVTIMSMLIGGAWVIGSTTASTRVQLDDQGKSINQLVVMRSRELDLIEHRLDHLEDRGGRGDQQSAAQQP